MSNLTDLQKSLEDVSRQFRELDDEQHDVKRTKTMTEKEKPPMTGVATNDAEIFKTLAFERHFENRSHYLYVRDFFALHGGRIVVPQKKNPQ